LRAGGGEGGSAVLSVEVQSSLSAIEEEETRVDGPLLLAIAESRFCCSSRMALRLAPSSYAATEASVSSYVRQSFPHAVLVSLSSPSQIDPQERRRRCGRARKSLRLLRGGAMRNSPYLAGSTEPSERKQRAVEEDESKCGHFSNRRAHNFAPRPLFPLVVARSRPA
jgi:hypothetical protein